MVIKGSLWHGGRVIGCRPLDRVVEYFAPEGQPVGGWEEGELTVDNGVASWRWDLSGAYLSIDPYGSLYAATDVGAYETLTCIYADLVADSPVIVFRIIPPDIPAYAANPIPIVLVFVRAAA